MAAVRLIDVSDEELLARTPDEPEALGVFHDRFERQVLGFLSHATGQSDVAADLTAEVFAAALVGASGFRPELGSAQEWLFGIPRGSSRITGAPFVLIDVSFTARVGVTNSHSSYPADFNYARSPGCTVGGTGGPTHTDIRAGQRIHIQDFVPLSCPGPVHGIVTYVQSSGLGPPGPASSPSGTSLLVGRFDVNPTASQRARR